jgi:8-oxo-dGTP pyrophosphatase MutT (NUDIX family)
MSNSQRWSVSWHPGPTPPRGRNHGSAGICLTEKGLVILVSADGSHWELPGGRPEDGESLEDALRREVAEEACTEVLDARLLGFSQGECIVGRELGLVLVRSFWQATVELKPWRPAFETRHRLLVAPAAVVSALELHGGFLPIYGRALGEAGVPGA